MIRRRQPHSMPPQPIPRDAASMMSNIALLVRKTASSDGWRRKAGGYSRTRTCSRVVGTAIDITARKQAEMALKDLNDTLEQRIEAAIAAREEVEAALRQSQKMEAVGQLTGGIAHDFNNMLAVVIGSLDLAQRQTTQDDVRLRRYIDAAYDGARRAANLTQRLLAFSRQQPLRPETVDTNKLGREHVRALAGLIGRCHRAGDSAGGRPLARQRRPQSA